MSTLIEEATRQLTICNACRYCEGLCAVFPALERRTTLNVEDISQLANLCHDCRACYDACMYIAPHEFGVNVPAALAAVRVGDYQRYLWPDPVPRVFSGRTGIMSGALLSSLVLLAIAVMHAGWSGLIRTRDVPQSPYALVPYWALLTLFGLASCYALAIGMLGARRYWSAVSCGKTKISLRVVARAIGQAATLRYLRGGGAECYYPEDDKPSAARRHLHGAVVFGFGLCLVSTVAAGLLQDIAGDQPPYPWLSVPVLTGTAGGIGMVIGCSGLLRLKARSSGVTSVAEMTVKDYGLLVALAFLALSGLATLLTRSTAAFGIVLLVHLSAVLLAISYAPYSKFTHAIFRFAALVQDCAERGPI